MKARLHSNAMAIGALAALIGSTATAFAAVTIPSTATGGFGSPNTGYTPMVAVRTVTGPSMITIRATGTINFGTGVQVGPNGGVYPAAQAGSLDSTPLDESVGVTFSSFSGAQLGHHASLIGAFVPQSVVSNPKFQPVDGTKGIAAVGIAPSQLFFVGNLHAIVVNTAGTLYLGINDNMVGDNSGSFTVTTSSP